MKLYIKRITQGSKSGMEFSASTKQVLEQVIQWVRDHPYQFDDGDFSSQPEPTIILRLLAEADIVYEYENNNPKCTYIFKQGHRQGEQCGTPVDEDGDIYCAYHDNPIFTGVFQTLFEDALSLALPSKIPKKKHCGVKHIPGEMCSTCIKSIAAADFAATRTIDVTTPQPQVSHSTQVKSYKGFWFDDSPTYPKAEMPAKVGTEAPTENIVKDENHVKVETCIRASVDDKVETPVLKERFRVHLYRDNPPLFRIDGTKIIIIVKQHGVNVVGAISDTEDSFRKLTEKEIIHCGQMGFLMDVSALDF